jgi:polyferredoxin
MSLSLPAKTIRRLSQIFFTAVCLDIGWRFALFLEWTRGGGAGIVHRPAGVEAFLPLAALMGFKNLLTTGSYDPVHPAGLTVFLAALAMSFLLRKSFCAQVCPVGLASDLLGLAGKRLGLRLRAPGLLARCAGAVKYVLLGFFLVSIFVLMDQAQVSQFLTGSYNLTADARLFDLFASPSGRFLAVLGFLAAAGMVFRNAWCRWLCPYGAWLGLFGLAGPCGVRRDRESCDGCRKCQWACPMDIAPGAAARSPLCMSCGQCVEACPRPGTLTMRFFGKTVPAAWPLLGGLAVFAGACGLAMLLGAWDNSLPPDMLRRLYAMAAR